VRQVLCDLCKHTVPMNDAFILGEATVCGACCENAQKESNADAPLSIRQQIDPTVCRRCNSDGGNLTLPTVAGMPICEACYVYMHHYPFPAWIKASAVGLALLIVFATMWNLRFVRGYREMHGSMVALGQGDVVLADSMAHAAARHVPESLDLAALASYFDGLANLRENKSAEALTSLKRAGERLPPSFGVDDLILQARIGVAFDNKNYDEYLALATQEAKERPNDAGIRAMEASALACKYVATGNESLREQALASLKLAKDLAAGAPGMANYEQRILHRLSSREVINENEFNLRFPHGWQDGKEVQQ